MNEEDLLPDTGVPLLLRCVGVREETRSAKSYVFTLDAGGDLRFAAGQFLNFAFVADGEEHLRSYTISSSAAQSRTFSITVKRVPDGRMSNWLFDHLKVGDLVRADGPYGQFTCDESPSEPLLLLTAGSGITPAAAIVRTLVDSGSAADVIMVHFADSAEEMIFRDEMAHWARSLPALRIIPVASIPQPYSGWVGVRGMLTEGLMLGLVPDLVARRILCCGPAGFMAAARQIAARAGVPDDRFMTESFDAPASDDAPDMAEEARDQVLVRFAKSDRACEVGPNTTILGAARKADVRIPSSCGKGLCGTCRVKLLSGTVEMNHQGGIRQREIDQGFILACCSKPTSDVVIDR